MSWRHVVFGIASLLLGLGCRRDDNGGGGALPDPLALASALAASAQPQVTGSLHSVGGSMGTWDLVLDDCQSGDYKGFFGVDLFPRGTEHMRLRYVHDEAHGEVVKVAYPQHLDEALVLDSDAKCSLLEGSVEKTTDSTRVVGRGYIPHLKGHIKLDCSVDSGSGHIFGEVTFAHCH